MVRVCVLKKYRVRCAGKDLHAVTAPQGFRESYISVVCIYGVRKAEIRHLSSVLVTKALVYRGYRVLKYRVTQKCVRHLAD